MEHTATYSPEDNKLRLYPATRLEPALYERVKSLGFIWAAKQGLFVAPMWTPSRFDFLIELCGEVGDEETSLEERQAERAERFKGYQDKRASDANRAAQHVQEIAGRQEFGQPILIGHHSQRKAERDKAKIENGMRHAVKMWETSKYWTERAAGAIAHARYKEKPDVRARRIKTLGAEMRKHERNVKDAQSKLDMWNKPEVLTNPKLAALVAGHCWGLTLPLKEGDKTDKKPTAYDVLRLDPYNDNYTARTVQEVVDAANIAYPRTIAHQERWIEHFKNRIAYETALLNEQGAGDLIAPKARPKQKPICNYPQAVTIKSRYGNAPETFTPHPMTKAEYAEQVKRDNTGTWEAVDGSHRVKVALIPDATKERYKWKYAPVFITDSKVTMPPTFTPDAAPVAVGE